jgi:hypothetical protein
MRKKREWPDMEFHLISGWPTLAELALFCPCTSFFHRASILLRKWGQQMGSGNAFQQFAPRRKVETTDFEEVCAKLLLIQKVTANSAI